MRDFVRLLALSWSMRIALLVSVAVLVVALVLVLRRPSEGTAEVSSPPTAVPQVTAVKPVAITEPTGTPLAVPTPSRTPTRSQVPAATSIVESTPQGPKGLALVPDGTIRIVARGTFVDRGDGVRHATASTGSGFLVSEEGLAVTANHVVTGASSLNVRVPGKGTVNARVVGASECADLAVIDLAGGGYTPLQFAEDDPAGGTRIFVTAQAHGEQRFELVAGSVAEAPGPGNSIWASLGQSLQHDAIVAAGDSGGPVVTDEGLVVGIHHATRMAVGQSFAIGLNEALPILDQLSQGRNVDWIGINGEAFTDGETTTGVSVSSVASGSPADRVGIRAGDVILELEGLALAEDGTLAVYCNILRTQSSGAPMQVRVLRGGTAQILVGQINGRALKVVRNLARRPNGTSDHPKVIDVGGSIELGSHVSGAIGELEVDIWTFEGVKGQHVTVEVEGFDALLRLFGPEGELIYENKDELAGFSSGVSAFLRSNGTYTIEVSGAVGNVGEYELALAPSVIRDFGPLPVDGTVIGSISEPRQIDIHRFDGVKGDTLRVTTRGVKTVITVYGPTLDRIGTDDGGAEEGESLFLLDVFVGGEYFVEVRGHNDARGEYGIQLTKVRISLSGAFVLTQGEDSAGKGGNLGACGFTDGPETSGMMFLEIDADTGHANATLFGGGSGLRIGLTCGDTTGDLAWWREYDAVLRGSYDGNTGSVSLRGELEGEGSSQWVHCRHDGDQVACPLRQNERYLLDISVEGNVFQVSRLAQGTMRVNTASVFPTEGVWITTEQKATATFVMEQRDGEMDGRCMVAPVPTSRGFLDIVVNVVDGTAIGRMSSGGSGVRRGVNCRSSKFGLVGDNYYSAELNGTWNPRTSELMLDGVLVGRTMATRVDCYDRGGNSEVCPDPFDETYRVGITLEGELVRDGAHFFGDGTFVVDDAIMPAIGSWTAI